MNHPAQRSIFCGKCRRHEPGGSGTGRQYRCRRCSANRLAAILTGQARLKPTGRTTPARVSTPEAA